MAPSTKHLPFLFLLLVVSSLQIQARESQFFSKVTPYSYTTNNNNNNFKEAEFPHKETSSCEQDEVVSFTPKTHNAHGLYVHGLYGHGSGQLPPITTTTTTNEKKYTSRNLPNKTPIDGYTSESFKYKEFNTRFPNNNEIGYETKPYTSYNDKNIGHETKLQGMSDTRYLENGKYFYDVNNENYYRNGYAPVRRSRRRFRPAKGMDSRSKYNNVGYYGSNNVNEYESNNSMEGYQNQEYHQENQDQEEYVP